MKSEELLKELQLLTAKPALKSAIEARASSRPSATLTEDELCRQAILRVGTAEQFGPSSQAMLLAKSLYPQVRDALLLTGSWTWAMKSTTVAETLPRPEYKWAYRYAIPSDCLRVFRVNDWDSAAADSAWEVAGNFVLTNADSGAPDWVAGRAYEVGNVVSSASSVYICRVANTTKEPGVTAGWTTDWDVWLGTAITLEYIRKTTEVTLFDSLFIDLLTANLAAKLAVPLTGDANKAALLSKEVEVLGKNPAMRRDSTERKGKIKPAWTSSKLVSSRSGGDGIDQAKATGAGPGGGVSYPSLLVTVGSVTNLPAGATPTVSNSGTGNTAVLNFGLPQSGVPTTLENSGLAIDGNSIVTTYNSSIGDGVVSVAVGGAPAAPASAWKAKNLVQVLDDILFPTILASVGSAKSLSLAVSGASGTLEIGSSHSRTLTATFGRGTILDGNGSTNANPLVGAASGYTFTGTGISSTSQTGNELAFTAAIVSGTNNWAVTATHAAGTGDYFDNKGVAGSNLAAQRAAGSATDSTSAPTITGVHPYYYLKRSTPITAADMVAAIQAGTATKVIASSTGTLSIPYAPSAEYFAVAYPSTSTTKTRYYVTALDNGAITVVFAPVATQTVTTALWSQSYRIHTSNGALTNSNATIELRNT